MLKATLDTEVISPANLLLQPSQPMPVLASPRLSYAPAMKPLVCLKSWSRVGGHLCMYHRPLSSGSWSLAAGANSDCQQRCVQYQRAYHPASQQSPQPCITSVMFKARSGCVLGPTERPHAGWLANLVPFIYSAWLRNTVSLSVLFHNCDDITTLSQSNDCTWHSAHYWICFVFYCALLHECAQSCITELYTELGAGSNQWKSSDI